MEAELSKYDRQSCSMINQFQFKHTKLQEPGHAQHFTENESKNAANLQIEKIVSSKNIPNSNVIESRYPDYGSTHLCKRN